MDETTNMTVMFKRGVPAVLINVTDREGNQVLVTPIGVDVDNEIDALTRDTAILYLEHALAKLRTTPAL